jgi:hypothetical protein
VFPQCPCHLIEAAGYGGVEGHGAGFVVSVGIGAAGEQQLRRSRIQFRGVSRKVIARRSPIYFGSAGNTVFGVGGTRILRTLFRRTGTALVTVVGELS